MEILKNKKCPQCGCIKIREEKRWKAYGGDSGTSYNESCKLECDFIFSYNGFTKEIKEEGECHKNVSYFEQKELMEMALKKLEEYIKELDVDEEFKRSIINWSWVNNKRLRWG